MMIPVVETAAITLVLGFLSLYCIWGLGSERSSPGAIEYQTRKPAQGREPLESRGAVATSAAGRRRRHATARTARRSGRSGRPKRLAVTLLAAIHARQAGDASRGGS